MSKDSEVLLTLAATVEVDGNLVLLSKGDEIPKGVGKQEMERLRANGSIGKEGDLVVPAEEEMGAPVESEVAVWVAESNASEVIEAADSPERAKELLDAEKQGKNRKTVVESLEEIIG